MVQARLRTDSLFKPVKPQVCAIALTKSTLTKPLRCFVVPVVIDNCVCDPQAAQYKTSVLSTLATYSTEMPSPRIPSKTSYLTLKVFLGTTKGAEKLVLPQLDIVLDQPTTSPRHVYPTSPVRIHRTYDLAQADLELVYNTAVKTLTVCSRGRIGALFDMARLPPSFDERSLCQRYSGGRELPPLATYLFNAARSFALLKHRNERLGPRDMRSAVALWSSVIVRGPGNPAVVPTHSQVQEILAQEKFPALVKGMGRPIDFKVDAEDGYGCCVLNSNLNPLHVAVVKISSATLEPGKHLSHFV